MRKHYLDNLRYGIVLSVIFYHVIYLFNSVGVIRNVDIPGIPAMDVFLYILYPWFMPCLFIISGVSARHALARQTAREFWRARVRRLLIPSIAGIFLLGWVNGWVTNQYTDMFAGAGDLIPGVVKYLIWCISGIGPLWYIHQLMAAYLVLFLIRKIDRKDRLTALAGKVGLPGLLLLLIPFWGSAQILNTPLLEIYRNGIYIFSFLLGYYLFSREETEALLRRYRGLFTAAAAVLCAGYTLYYFGQNYALMENLKSLLTNAFGWFGCLAALSLALRYLDRETGFTRYMAGRSFGFYVLHYPLMAFLTWVLDSLLHLPIAAMYPAVLVATAALLPPLTALIKRFPFLNKILLGY